MADIPYPGNISFKLEFTRIDNSNMLIINDDTVVKNMSDVFFRYDSEGLVLSFGINDSQRVENQTSRQRFRMDLIPYSPSKSE